jgi:hypothetical protein
MLCKWSTLAGGLMEGLNAIFYSEGFATEWQ